MTINDPKLLRMKIKELERKLRNAVAKLNCGNHPGMSCIEMHEDDAYHYAVLAKAFNRLTLRNSKQERKIDA